MENIISIKLKTLHDINEFVAKANKVNGKIYALQFEYCVNAKSNLGVMSLDPSSTINVKFIDCSESEIEEFKKWGV